ncbi:hypothetical protein P167DRAFT_122053 [Morchella conica CCBAS932]|uniref:Uncharacterized protein n=1 Tax=Morchella conica CCBAS932 TaxID=1392247 RepID=A0A3N4L620_9PEZI|nr:hypothetical protein P167DRAFT_122053 [Morchella conica CCBAS932]
MFGTCHTVHEHPSTRNRNGLCIIGGRTAFNVFVCFSVVARNLYHLAVAVHTTNQPVQHSTGRMSNCPIDLKISVEPRHVGRWLSSSLPFYPIPLRLQHHHNHHQATVIINLSFLRARPV